MLQFKFLVTIWSCVCVYACSYCYCYYFIIIIIIVVVAWLWLWCLVCCLQSCVCYNTNNCWIEQIETATSQIRIEWSSMHGRWLMGEYPCQFVFAATSKRGLLDWMMVVSCYWQCFLSFVFVLLVIER